MTVKRPAPYVWATWLSRVVAGDRSCVWAAWFMAQNKGYAKRPSGFDLGRWKIEHTRLLTDFALERQRQGNQIHIENQNSFKYKRQSGLVLAGTPDLVCTHDDGATVYDIKTGKQRTSDQAQVMVYMYCLPRCREEYKDMKLDGVVVYGEDRVAIPADSIDDAFSENLHHFLDILEADHPALKVPTTSECGFCDLTTADCPERIDAPLSDDDEDEEGSTE